MKKIMTMMLAAALAMGAMADTKTATVETEVYINVPGERAIHCPVATLTFLDHGVVKVETSWGVTYITHLANVVIVTRKQGGVRK